LTPKETLSAANVTSAVNTTSPPVQRTPRRHARPRSSAQAIQIAPSFSTLPSATKKSFAGPKRCFATQTATASSIELVKPRLGDATWLS
jgi:hypothetical protein